MENIMLGYKNTYRLFLSKQSEKKYFTSVWIRRIYEFFCVHSNPIWKSRNYRDYRPSHLIFREYFRPFWFSRSCVVAAYCNRACAVQMYKALSVRCQRCTLVLFCFKNYLKNYFYKVSEKWRMKCKRCYVNGISIT